MDKQPGRLLDSLPAVLRAADGSGDLRRLLNAFEGILLGEQDADRPGIEEEIDGIARYIAPLPPDGGDEGMMCPDRFLPWLAGWVAFSPHALFAPPQLRKIIAGIVPLYTRRGTAAYMAQLLRLCFDEIDAVDLDEAPGGGLRLGHARTGIDSLLGSDSPFQFAVVLTLRADQTLPGPHDTLEQRVRAMIDFAKPAHTAYDLAFRHGGPERHTRDAATRDRPAPQASTSRRD